jgi:hypothetical protein
MTANQPFDVQDILPVVSWRDVLEINVEGFSEQDIQQIEDALDQIEETRSGQTLLRAMQLKLQERGQESISINHDPKEIAGYHVFNESIVLNLETFDMVAFHLPDGNKVKPLLSEVLFHEFVHYVDNNGLIAKRALDVLAQHEQQHGLLALSPDRDIFTVESHDAFLESLPEHQREALTSLREAADDTSLSDADFERIFAEKIGILRENPTLETIYQASHLVTESRTDEAVLQFEHLAVSRSNIFSAEIGSPYRRMSYFAGEVDESNREIPALELRPIDNVIDRVEAQQEAEEWQERYGDVTMRGHRLQVLDLNPVIPAFVREALERNGVMMDVPLTQPLSLSTIERVPQLSFTEVTEHHPAVATPPVASTSPSLFIG